MKKQNVRTLSFIICTFTYLLFGAAIFDALESQKEETVRINLENSEKFYKDTYNISSHDYSTLEDIVIKYHPYRTFPQWKFTGAFYFSLTVITTIGYGHSTPQTVPGKIFCMIYAIVGIPLCLIMFQSVGERLNYFASFCIEFVKKCVQVKKTEVNQTEMVLVAAAFTVLAVAAGAMMFSRYEGWSLFDSIYYCVITLTTIGFGDYVALQDKSNLQNTSYVVFSFTFILFGLTVVASGLNLLVLKFLTMNTDDERREEFTRKVNERRSLEMSQSNLLNIDGNGHVLCTFSPETLNDLKKENSLNFYQSIRSSFRTFLQKKSSHFGWNNNVNNSSINKNNGISSNDTKESKNDKDSHDYNGCLSKNRIKRPAYNSKTDDAVASSKKQICPECLVQLKRSKKNHYTIRRAPGKISHLIPTSNSNDLIINFDKNSNRILV